MKARNRDCLFPVKKGLNPYQIPYNLLTPIKAIRSFLVYFRDSIAQNKRWLTINNGYGEDIHISYLWSGRGNKLMNRLKTCYTNLDNLFSMDCLRRIEAACLGPLSFVMLHGISRDSACLNFWTYTLFTHETCNQKKKQGKYETPSLTRYVQIIFIQASGRGHWGLGAGKNEYLELVVRSP